MNSSRKLASSWMSTLCALCLNRDDENVNSGGDNSSSGDTTAFVDVEANTITFRKLQSQIKFRLTGLEMYPTSCRGLRWSVSSELHLSLHARSTGDGAYGLDFQGQDNGVTHHASENGYSSQDRTGQTSLTYGSATTITMVTRQKKFQFLRNHKHTQLLSLVVNPSALLPDLKTACVADGLVEDFLCQLLRDQSRQYTSFRFLVQSSHEEHSDNLPIVLLIWLLDQNLQVFSSERSVSPRTGKKVTDVTATCVLKVLYKGRFVDSKHTKSHEAKNDIFKSWERDNSVHGLDLPYPLCKQLLSLLISSTKQLPVSQRSLNSFH
ncbi:hypothetical protein BaRGS_00035297, partial [Batillaria attramentaria]